MSTTSPARDQELRCPHCHARLAQDQEWCLECGRAVDRRLVAPKPRRLALALAGLAVALAAMAVALAIVSLASRGGSSQQTAAPAPPQATAPPATASTPAPASSTSTARSTPPPTTPATAASAPMWPAGLQAYTVVLVTTTSRATAERRAQRLVARGADAGILKSDDYASFSPGNWIVWRGRYQSRAKAQQALDLLRNAGTSAYLTFVRRRT